jgi:hypothetical protein
MTSRQLTLFALACFVLAIPLSHSAISAKKKATKKKAGAAPKVALCHFPDDSDVGHVIEVSSNAVAAHVEKHGDCTAFVARPNGACRCLTCLESCTATFDRCVEGCGHYVGDTPTDPCVDECIAKGTRCRLGCNVIGPAG